LEIGERPYGALGVDAVEQHVGEPAHVAQTHAHCAGGWLRVPSRLRPPEWTGIGAPQLQRAVAPRPCNARPEYLHAVAYGITDDRVRRVETHGLRVEQRARELRRMVQLDPRARVHEVGKAHRVALGEAEVGERLELARDLLRGLPHDPLLGHA